ncbi:ankyrin repeat domain-containing protein 16-like isoform X2 [Babylonia areolata]|uniref:ankyrin repeat domain-containing protein 16-like isoform X2 n=1 Tax=Babylonia areolata TaxID=304850 RepID=UPI003FD5DD88
MNHLCLCWPCVSLTDKSQRKPLSKSVKEEGDGNHGTFQPSTPKHRLTSHKHGVRYRLQEILHQECQTRDQLHKLLHFVYKILDDCDRVDSRTTPTTSTSRHDDPTVLHTILDALPTEEAARDSCRELLQVLEKNGFDMSMLYGGASSDTPLLRAVKTSNRGALDALLHTQRCDINATDRYSSTCLIYAVKADDRDTVRTILRRFPRAVNLDKADYANYTALAYAASSDCLEMCSLLLQAGARPDVNSTSPLFLAVSNNASLELIQLLISEGASVNVSNSDGLNALAAAARNRKPEVVSLLLEHGANLSSAWHKTRAFLIALAMDHLDILKILMCHGMDVTCPNPKGSTVVHEACCQGSARFLSYLIRTTNVDLDVRNRQRCSAAHYAAQYGHSVCLEVLFHAGGDCWSPDPRGHSTLEIALFNNRSDCVSFLVGHQVFPRQKLFSTLHVLHNHYDPDALSRKPAVALFTSLLQNKWREGSQVDTLLNTCLINTRRSLHQQPALKVAQLPLPEKVKERILSY